MTTTVSASAPPKLGYRPSLDGLRAVSVMAVVLYHAGVSWMPGGFLGVEVFFVVSGFLITALLIDERHHSGAISLRQFWIRRARRLLPALYLLLAVVSVASMLVYRDAAGRMGGDVLAALFYVSNWWQIYLSESYFAQAGRPPLLQHLWSLAIEEQFYLVFPPLFALGAGPQGPQGHPLGAHRPGAGVLGLDGHPVRGVHGPLQRLLLHLHPGLRPAARRGPGPQLGPVAVPGPGRPRRRHGPERHRCARPGHHRLVLHPGERLRPVHLPRRLPAAGHRVRGGHRRPRPPHRGPQHGVGLGPAAVDRPAVVLHLPVALADLHGHPAGAGPALHRLARVRAPHGTDLRRGGGVLPLRGAAAAQGGGR